MFATVSIATEIKDFNVTLQEPGERQPPPMPGAVDVPFLGIELIHPGVGLADSFLVNLFPGSTIAPADITAIRLYVDRW